MTPYILFLLGFILLIKGADWLVSGASSLAYRFRVSDLVVGLTIVAFGTSAPELIVSLLASMDGNTTLAISNVTGSNIANILLILGISATIHPLTVQKNTTWKEIPFALLAVLVLFLLANDQIIDGANISTISRIDGFVLISFLVIFLYYIFGTTLESSEKKEVSNESFNSLKVTLQIIVGLIILVVGGKWIVDGAVFFANSFGVSESLIGLTIIAVGTSLPELATSIVAAYKKNSDIAVGNIVGSNIFNIFWILGISAIITPLSFNLNANIDVLVAISATLLLFSTLFLGKKHTVEKWQGVVFVLIYILYIVYLIIRG